MARDPSWRGAVQAALLVALYLPTQPALAWVLVRAGLPGAEGLDGLARWTSTAVVLLLGAALASVLAADWQRRDGRGAMQRWALGTAAGLAVLIVLSALLTLAQAMLTWRLDEAAAVMLVVDAAWLTALAGVAVFALEPRPRLALWQASTS